MHPFNGRVSEKLYDEKLKKLQDVLRYIYETEEPVEAENGALWIDDNVLKIKLNDVFTPLYKNTFQGMSALIQPNKPVNPTPGQLWLDDGVLIYYTGIRWEPVKAGLLDEYSIDTYEPFLILENLEAGANEVIKVPKDYIEENLIAKAGTREFPLRFGTYEPAQNKIVVYLNGRLIPKKDYLEPNDSLVRFINPLLKEEYITVQYIPKGHTPSEKFKPLKFHPAMREDIYTVTKNTYTFTLTKEALFGQSYVNVYLNGRFIPHHYFMLEDSFTVRFHQGLETTEEIIIQYIDKKIYDELPPGDTTITEEPVPYSQYLWPDSDLDRLFMNGKLNLDYERVNNVTIQYPSEKVQGSIISAVHINPNHLYNVTKRMFKIDPTMPFIQVVHSNTEFYGLGVDKTGKTVSKFLVSTKKSDTDYTTYPGGISLSNYITNNFDYLLAIQYNFTNTSARGRLVKKHFMVTDDTQIPVGTIYDPLLLFAQGHYLVEEGNYSYDQENGIITLVFPEKVDIGIITFPHHEKGKILTLQNGKGVIPINRVPTKPLVFVYGENMQQLVDYTRDNNTFLVENAKVNMSYAIVDCIDDYGDSMYVGEGTLLFDAAKNRYYLPADFDFESITPILFVQGMLMSKKDLEYDSTHQRLYIKQGGDLAQKYVLLKDIKSRYIYSAVKENGIFSVSEHVDVSLLYIDGHIINDLEAFGVTALPAKGYENEVKALMHYDKGYKVEDWFIYHINEWQVQPKDSALDTRFSQYILEDHIVNFIDPTPFIGKMCDAYFYQYDYRVEHELVFGQYNLSESTTYETYPSHSFMQNQNNLMVYIDGIRQYPATFDYPIGIQELGRNQFQIPVAHPGSHMTYLIEKPELDEVFGYEFEIFNGTQIENGVLNVNHMLIPGHIAVFIDGLRQPKETVVAIDEFHLQIKGYYPDPRYKNWILVETRRDLYIREKTVVADYDNQILFRCDDIILPTNVLGARDFIKIYLNGVFVGKDYHIDLVQKTLVVSKPWFKNSTRKGDIITIEWR